MSSIGESLISTGCITLPKDITDDMLSSVDIEDTSASELIISYLQELKDIHERSDSQNQHRGGYRGPLTRENVENTVIDIVSKILTIIIILCLRGIPVFVVISFIETSGLSPVFGQYVTNYAFCDPPTTAYSRLRWIGQGMLAEMNPNVLSCSQVTVLYEDFIRKVANIIGATSATIGYGALNRQVKNFLLTQCTSSDVTIEELDEPIVHSDDDTLVKQKGQGRRRKRKTHKRRDNHRSWRTYTKKMLRKHR